VKFPGRPLFLNRKAAKEAQLDDSALLPVQARKLGQRAVEVEQVDGLTLHDCMHILKGAVIEAAASLCRSLIARVTDEDLAHEQRTHSDEMRFVPKVTPELVMQAQVSLVDESGCLQGAR
jgi:hypothetical protein